MAVLPVGGLLVSALDLSIYHFYRQRDAIRERLAVVEATCERVPSSRPAVECRADGDCGQGRECRRDRCVDFVKSVAHRPRLTYDNVQKFVQQKQAPLDMAAPDAPAAE